MQYNFDEQLDRRNTNSYKWAVGSDELPMWVADMDFRTAPEVTTALQHRLAQDAFGYTIVPESFNQSIIKWWEKRHQFKIESEWVLFCTGVVPAISSIVRKLTNEGDSIVLLTPVYNIFFNSIVNNHRVVLESPLEYNGSEYDINFFDLEEKLSQQKTKMLILCNPHNPIGKVWGRETLSKIGALCVKYNVLMLSDDIHCDLVHAGSSYTPLAAINKEIAGKTIMCLSATKAFNLAGLQTAAIVIPDSQLRKQIERGINTDEVAEPNVFAIQAMQAAFDHGEPWLNALNAYLTTNREYLINYISKELPAMRYVPSEATYLAWLDCSSITEDTKTLCRFIREKTRLFLSEGDMFGGNGHRFIRLNYACPFSVLQDGLKRLKKGVEVFVDAEL